MDYLGDYHIKLHSLALPASYGGYKTGPVEYALEESVTIKEDQFFSLLLTAHGPVRLRIGNHMFDVPAIDSEVLVNMELPDGAEFRSFSIDAGGSDPGIKKAGIARDTADVSMNRISFRDDLIIIEPAERDNALYLGFQSEIRSDSENITVSDRSGMSYGIRTKKGTNPYWFYNSAEGFSTEAVSIQMENAVLETVRFNETIEEGQGIPLDLEELIYRDPSLWRRDDFELYRWNLFPELLIIDTYSYAIQSDFLKRLAFFTEKKISAGELLSDEDLDGLHGWNAHDYKAPDLARFFNKASEEGFPLNEKELELREILISNGVLRESSGRVRPGRGGILSISRSSSERLRWLFLTHECYHGIFFVSPEFVSNSTAIWRSLSDDERDFWRIFLDMYGYNVADEYLLINEFQAYLMQQDTSLADSYFRGKINWILGFRPELKNKMDRLLSEYGDTFEKSARLVEESAFSLTGIRAGDLVLKRKK